MVEAEKEKMDKLEDMQKKLQGLMEMQKMEQSKCCLTNNEFMM